MDEHVDDDHHEEDQSDGGAVEYVEDEDQAQDHDVDKDDDQCGVDDDDDEDRHGDDEHAEHMPRPGNFLVCKCCPLSCRSYRLQGQSASLYASEH